MGLGDFLSGVKDAAVNVGKGAVWAANPEHWDDIAEGAGNAVEFAVENPGQVWDTGFEVGRAMLKDQLDPVNLAINAGLIGLTVATGGAAAPAFLAKMGMGVKTAEVGLEAAKAVDTAADVAKGVNTAVKAVDTASDIAKGVETATDVAKTVETAADVGETLGRGQRFMQGAREVGQGIREAPGMEKLGKVLDAGTELKGAARESLGMSRYGGMATRRAAAGERILGEAGQEAGFIRRTAAQAVSGGPANAAYKGPVSTMARASHRVEQVRDLADTSEISDAQRAVEVAADPKKAAMEAATSHINEVVGTGTGYSDRGQTAESLYAGASPSNAPGPAVSFEAASSTWPRTIEPGSPTPTAPATSSSTQRRINGRTPDYAAGEDISGWSPTQRFWQGPTREWAGGIGPGHDWRPMKMRQVEYPSVATAGTYKAAKAQMPGNQTSLASEGWGSLTSRPGPKLTDQGAPVNFAPEIDKGGSFSMSTGQAPEGSGGFGEFDFGTSPMYQQGSRTSRRNNAFASDFGFTNQAGNPVVSATGSPEGVSTWPKAPQGTVMSPQQMSKAQRGFT